MQRFNTRTSFFLSLHLVINFTLNLAAMCAAMFLR